MDIAPVASIEEIVSLLAESDLPVADIRPDSPVQFFGMRTAGSLVAVVGLELYPPVGLLRSLAVRPSARGYGLGRQLLAFAETFAGNRGVSSLYLLTTTASDYFIRHGYEPALRSSAPEAIRATSQFSGLCPASSRLLSRSLPE